MSLKMAAHLQLTVIALALFLLGAEGRCPGFENSGSDVTTLLGALNGVNSLEGFLGSLGVPKIRSILPFPWNLIKTHGPSLPAPAPEPEASAAGCQTCVYDHARDDLLYFVLQIVYLVVLLILQIVFAVVSIVASLLGPATDTTTLLGALNGVNTLEGFLGSLPIVPKLLNILNVPTAILG